MNERDLHGRASALFLEVRELSPGEREARLSREVDAALVAEVRSLLAHDATAGPSPDDDALPARIGPYRVVRRLGRGGGGVVLLAEQDSPVRRRLAVKISPFATIDPSAAARFEYERRALEQTEHPNIARILDAGTTPEGLPYIAMEYVEGDPITVYCDRAGLGVAERVSLVIEAADAVQHAHQRGVIHRDLKPGNIFVSESGGRASVRILDFGIARPVVRGGSEATLTSGGALGTPQYMAPEQTGAGVVDTRADVYALGAVLYELVAGRPPLEQGDDAYETMRRVREEPPAPVSRARSSARRVPGVSRAVLQDLDRVLAKALEKSPERRYQTVSSFADDLARLLRSEPVLARAPSASYRCSRFVRRHKAGVFAAASVAVALGVGVAGLAAGLREAQRQRLDAMRQRDAQREINRFLTEDLLAAASADREGQHATALDLLRSAGRRAEARFARNPQIGASVQLTLGDAYAELGEFDQAQFHYARALDLWRGASGVDSPDAVRAEIALAGLLARRERYEDAEPALRGAVERARAFLGPDDAALYRALNDLGVVYESTDRGELAVATLQEALEGRARLLGSDDPLVLTTTSNLAQAYDRVGSPERSLSLMRDALRIAQAMPDPPRMTLLGLQNNIGATLQDLGREAEAAPFLRTAAALAIEVLGDEHPATLTIRGNLAGLEAKVGDPLAAASMYEEIVQIQERVFGDDAAGSMATRYGRCNALRLGGRLDEALPCYEDAVARMARVLGDAHWLTNQARVGLARVLVDLGRPAEATPHAALGASHLTALYGPDHPRARTANLLLEEIRVSNPGG